MKARRGRGKILELACCWLGVVPINIIQRVSGRTGSLQKTHVRGTGSLQNLVDRTGIARGSHEDRTNPAPFSDTLIRQVRCSAAWHVRGTGSLQNLVAQDRFRKQTCVGQDRSKT